MGCVLQDFDEHFATRPRNLPSLTEIVVKLSEIVGNCRKLRGSPNPTSREGITNPVITVMYLEWSIGLVLGFVRWSGMLECHNNMTSPIGQFSKIVVKLSKIVGNYRNFHSGPMKRPELAL